MPVANALLSWTPVSDSGAALSVRTSERGEYRIRCPARPNGYTVRLTRLGFASQWRTVVPSADTVRTDFVLKAVAQQLAAIQTRGTRPAPRMSTNGGGRPPGANVVSLDLSNDVNGDGMGDLSTALAMVPGLSLTPDGLSAFGAGPDQQGTTLNGMDFGGSPPRDGVQPAVYLSTYDPRQGRFAGAHIAYALASGTDAPSRLLHLTAADPPLQWGPTANRAFSGPMKRNILSGFASGRLGSSNKFYSVAGQVEQRGGEVSPLDAASPALLTGLRLDPDRIEELMSAARSVGLPVSPDRRARQTMSTSLTSRLDLTDGASSRQMRAGDSPRDEAYLLMNTGWRRSTGLGLSPVAAASTEATRRHVDVQGMGEWLTYRFAPVTTDMKLSVALSEDRARPLTGLPTATVLVDSPISASAGLVPITLGGNSESSNSLRDGRAQFTTDLAWYTWNRSHRIDVFTDLELERYRSSDVPNTLGTFSFNSTRNLIEGTPAVFERTLGRSATAVPVFRGALAVGDVYTPGGAGDLRSTGDAGITIQYGLRADFERFGRFGAANPHAASLFGIETGILRPSFTVQPMIGFTWNWSRYSVRVQDLQMLRHRNTLSGGIREGSSGNRVGRVAFRPELQPRGVSWTIESCTRSSWD